MQIFVFRLRNKRKGFHSFIHTISDEIEILLKIQKSNKSPKSGNDKYHKLLNQNN